MFIFISILPSEKSKIKKCCNAVQFIRIFFDDTFRVYYRLWIVRSALIRKPHKGVVMTHDSDNDDAPLTKDFVALFFCALHFLESAATLKMHRCNSFRRKTFVHRALIHKHHLHHANIFHSQTRQIPKNIAKYICNPNSMHSSHESFACALCVAYSAHIVHVND